MRVRLLCSIAGPPVVGEDGSYTSVGISWSAGDVIDLDDETAHRLITAGSAEPVERITTPEEIQNKAKVVRKR